jgi:hypothetical protein
LLNLARGVSLQECRYKGKDDPFSLNSVGVSPGTTNQHMNSGRRIAENRGADVSTSALLKTDAALFVLWLCSGRSTQTASENKSARSGDPGLQAGIAGTQFD